jgi:hypothetical protein
MGVKKEHRYLVSWDFDGKRGHHHVYMGPEIWSSGKDTESVMDYIKDRAQLGARPVITSVFYMGEFDMEESK